MQGILIYQYNLSKLSYKWKYFKLKVSNSPIMTQFHTCKLNTFLLSHAGIHPVIHRMKVLSPDRCWKDHNSLVSLVCSCVLHFIGSTIGTLDCHLILKFIRSSDKRIEEKKDSLKIKSLKNKYNNAMHFLKGMFPRNLLK